MLSTMICFLGLGLGLNANATMMAAAPVARLVVKTVRPASTRIYTMMSDNSLHLTVKSKNIPGGQIEGRFTNDVNYEKFDEIVNQSQDVRGSVLLKGRLTECKKQNQTLDYSVFVDRKEIGIASSIGCGKLIYAVNLENADNGLSNSASQTIVKLFNQILAAYK
jgi:hypothetical protein